MVHIISRQQPARVPPPVVTLVLAIVDGMLQPLLARVGRWLNRRRPTAGARLAATASLPASLPIEAAVAIVGPVVDPPPDRVASAAVKTAAPCAARPMLSRAARLRRVARVNRRCHAGRVAARRPPRHAPRPVARIAAAARATGKRATGKRAPAKRAPDLFPTRRRQPVARTATLRVLRARPKLRASAMIIPWPTRTRRASPT
jgi:hypothetical protein